MDRSASRQTDPGKLSPNEQSPILAATGPARRLL